MLKKKLSLIVTAFVVVVISSCSGNEDSKTEEVTTEETKSTEEVNKVNSHGQSGVAAVEGEEANALQVAKSLDDFTTLVVAIEAAGVEDAVVNTGPLTIFAPLNSAFEKLPEGTVDNLLKPENKATLRMVLINHVAPSNYPIKQLKKEAKKGRKLYMASGKYLDIENKDGVIYVGGVPIIKSVKVSNGWIHVIDDVLVPAED